MRKRKKTFFYSQFFLKENQLNRADKIFQREFVREAFDREVAQLLHVSAEAGLERRGAEFAQHVGIGQRAGGRPHQARHVNY